MINLIPNEEKKKKVRDFYFRLATTFFAVMGVTIIVASVAILPAYFLSQVRRNVSYTKFNTEKKETTATEESTLAEAKDLDKKLSMIEKTGEHYLASKKVISAILLHKNSEIKISSINYSQDPKTGKVIIIGGVATSREQLITFKKALEGDQAFKKVELPISNFVKGSNIIFSMTITPA